MPNGVAATLLLDPHDELLRRIGEISTMCEELERAVKSLVELQGEQSESLESARELEATACALKRQLLQHYLECRIGEAALQGGAGEN
jgi:hypothetical protein